MSALLKPQTAKVLSILEKRPLSVKEAVSRYGIQNLSARVSELREAGYEIETAPLARGKGSKYVY